MNKKGFIFTFISVVLVSVIVLAFLIQYTSRTRVNIESVNTEVETFNSFVKALDNDYLGRALEVSANQAILSLLDCMDPLKVCDEDIEDQLEQKDGYLGENQNQLGNYIINAIMDGEFELDFGQAPNGPPLDLMEIDGVSYNLSATLNEIIRLANQTGVKFKYEDISKNDIDVFQDDDPWNINFSLTISYQVENGEGDISWDKDSVIKTSVPIKNFREPYYLVGAGINVSVNKSVYPLPEAIENHVLDVNFVQCNESPNFLNRLNGGTGSNEMSGIESIVDLKSAVVSSIDYQYLHVPRIDPDKAQIGASGYFIDETHDYCYNFEAP
tara:strand:- start:1478 stop:2458 length:981 start_codon:yes stop_codon:yes gene_type:complete